MKRELEQILNQRIQGEVIETPSRISSFEADIMRKVSNAIKDRVPGSKLIAGYVGLQEPLLDKFIGYHGLWIPEPLVPHDPDIDVLISLGLPQVEIVERVESSKEGIAKYLKRSFQHTRWRIQKRNYLQARDAQERRMRHGHDHHRPITFTLAQLKQFHASSLSTKDIAHFVDCPYQGLKDAFAPLGKRSQIVPYIWSTSYVKIGFRQASVLYYFQDCGLEGSPLFKKAEQTREIATLLLNNRAEFEHEIILKLRDLFAAKIDAPYVTKKEREEFIAEIK